MVRGDSGDLQHRRTSASRSKQATTSNGAGGGGASSTTTTNNRRAAKRRRSDGLMTDDQKKTALITTLLFASLAIQFIVIGKNFRHTSRVPPPRRSLLEVYSSAASNLPPCSANRISLNSAASSAPLDETKPTIFTDWDINTSGDISDIDRFIKAYGHFPLHVKMGDALPLWDANGEKCTASTKALLDAFIERFGNKSNNADNDELSASRPTNEDLLIFTSARENPDLFRAIQSQYKTPQPFSDFEAAVDENGVKPWLKIFSAMMRGSAHRFHKHDAAWLGQVSGARLWFLMPPEASVDAKPPACDYLTGRAPLPDVPGLMACVQSPGDVMYIPHRWYHATCGLEEWNVGVGEQLYAPAMEVPVVKGITEKEERDKLIECGALENTPRSWNLIPDGQSWTRD